MRTIHGGLEGRGAAGRAIRTGFALASMLLGFAAAAQADEMEPAAPAAAAPAEAAEESAAMPSAPASPAEEAMDPTPAETAAVEAPVADAPADGARRELGPVGYDEQGRAGRIHTVVRGDTLWDVSDAYLGTPWVWPSIWKDNDDIANPHRIYPGDRIWITPWEMRRLSAEEAAKRLAAQPSMPAAPAAEPMPEPPAAPAPAAVERVFHREAMEEIGLISDRELEATASIVKSQATRVLLGSGDRVYIGLGQDEVARGDQFTIFRTREKVFDPETGRMLGWHIDLLGWLEVIQPASESSLAEIRLSRAEMEVGDRLMKREAAPLDIPVGPSPLGVEGRISFFPNSRTLMASQDFVYLNRGSEDGISIGSPLEVYRQGSRVAETARDEKVALPDRVVAELLVVRAQPNSSVAVVRHTEEELELGDRFRGATR